MSLIALAYGGLRALSITSHIGEETMRKHILQQPNVAICGQMPQDLIVLKGDTSGGKFRLIASFDDEKVRKFQGTNVTREELGDRLFGALKEAAVDFDTHANAMVPYGLVHDRTARSSSVVETRLKAEAARVAAAGS